MINSSSRTGGSGTSATGEACFGLESTNEPADAPPGLLELSDTRVNCVILTSSSTRTVSELRGWVTLAVRNGAVLPRTI